MDVIDESIKRATSHFSNDASADYNKGRSGKSCSDHLIFHTSGINLIDCPCCANYKGIQFVLTNLNFFIFTKYMLKICNLSFSRCIFECHDNEIFVCQASAL